MKKLLIITLAFCGLNVYGQDAKTEAPDKKAEASAADAKKEEPKKEEGGAKADEDVAKVLLGVIPAQMKFDKTEFTVKPGQKVMLLFKNEKCPLQHNVIIIKPGTKDKVGGEADKMLADPNALKSNYVPNSPDILIKGTKLIGPGQSDLIEFTAPADEGDYPYICTFPGHWRLMNGVMKVKK